MVYIKWLTQLKLTNQWLLLSVDIGQWEISTTRNCEDNFTAARAQLRHNDNSKQTLW